MRVLFIERDMTKASPLKTLAASVVEGAADFAFVDFSKMSTGDFVKELLSSDVAVIQYYSEISDFDLRQLAVAIMFGVPIIRNWAGTDVLNVIRKDNVRKNAQEVDRLITRNVTLAHRGLVDELAQVSIKCELLPKVINFNILKEETWDSPESLSILAYLPSSNMTFYGADYVEGLIKKYSELHFIVIADDSHRFEKYDNVASLGWVEEEEMLRVWKGVGLLIRITEHDGFPRMVLEALGRGKYVIHNNRTMEGIMYADDAETLENKVEEYLTKRAINSEGIEILNSLRSAEPSKKYLDFLSKMSVTISDKLGALFYLIRHGFR